MNKFKKMVTKISNHLNAFRKIKCSRPCIKKIFYNAEVTFQGPVKFNFNMWFPKRKLDKGIIFLGYGSKVEFGNNVLIGMNCIILKGVSIGDGAVIGAGSIVTKDIPPHTLCAGNPAKVIKNNINWER